MHLAFIFYPHGGIGSITYDLTTELIKTGNRVTLFEIDTDNTDHRIFGTEKNNPKLKVIRVKGLPSSLHWRLRTYGNRVRLYCRLLQEHSRAPFTILQAPDYEGWIWPRLPFRIPTIAWIHGSNLLYDHLLNKNRYNINYRFERAWLKNAKRWVAVSSFAAAETQRLCGGTQMESKPVTIIHNSVNTDFFKAADPPSFDPGLIVFVNSISRRKGIPQLLEAMKIVCAKFPGAQLMLVGQDVEHPESDGTPFLKACLQQLPPEVRQKITVTGPLDRKTGVLEALRRAHVCCYPSLAETFGLAPLEAMAVGKPVVFSALGPGPELIADGISGLLCNPLQPQDIADKLLAILTDPDLAAKLGREGRRRVLEKFSHAQWVQHYLDLYTSLIPSP